jgi:hypothetical protein
MTMMRYGALEPADGSAIYALLQKWPMPLKSSQLNMMTKSESEIVMTKTLSIWPSLPVTAKSEILCHMYAMALND